MRQVIVSSINTGVLNTVSSGIDISDIQSVVVNVVQLTGTIAGAVITVEKSLDNTTWFTTGTTIAGAALSAEITISTQWMRLKVTTASGIASTAICTIQGKDGYFPAITNAVISTRTDVKSISGLLETLTKQLNTMTAFLFSIDKAQRRSKNDEPPQPI